MNDGLRLRIQTDDVQFHFPTSAITATDFEVSLHEITLPFQVFSDERFEVRHARSSIVQEFGICAADDATNEAKGKGLSAKREVMSNESESRRQEQTAGSNSRRRTE